MVASWKDRVVLWLLAVLASFGIAGALAISRWSAEYDTLAPLCRTASTECLNAVEHDATLVALAAFSVLFVIALVFSTAFVFRVQIFGGRPHTTGQSDQDSTETLASSPMAEGLEQ